MEHKLIGTEMFKLHYLGHGSKKCACEGSLASLSFLVHVQLHQL